MRSALVRRPLKWVGSSREDLARFPLTIRRRFGFALHLVQLGMTPADSKPLHGLGSGVLELASEWFGDAWRAVYVVRFAGAVYVLHAFQKKSSRGIRTSARDLELIRRRLRAAREDDDVHRA